ncbi:hypothetical protein BZL29_8485 [Mycobacterium kansasii]|uniref:Uncharacterized protein n=1 Tax=Mycobacterium kansasii TaxID=1768 RepID=A0A1V3W9J4_MYCKA|nr:hypothetical protein BZL29_8485 [Mycobacterium kansasii]
MRPSRSVISAFRCRARRSGRESAWDHEASAAPPAANTGGATG